MSDPVVAKTVTQEYAKLPISVTNRVDSFLNIEIKKRTFVALEMKGYNFSSIEAYDMA